MNTVQMHVNPNGDWIKCSKSQIVPGNQLVLIFWSDLDDGTVLNQVRKLQAMLPDALLLGCSTGGLIQDRLLLEGSMSATLVSFKYTHIHVVRNKVDEFPDSRSLGASLGAQLEHHELVHALVLADGLAIDGGHLAKGIADALPPHVAVTGGLAGDGTRFQRTSLLLNDEILDGEALCIGLYGNNLHVGYGSRGGWEPFGPERLITEASGNVLMELDGESALTLYERYLGKHAQGLPATGYFFPLNLRVEGRVNGVVRSILGIDREKKTMLFSGEMPKGATVQLMKCNVDSLVDGARDAGVEANLDLPGGLAFLVSCAGRKMVLGQFVDDEIDAVANALPAGTALTGFYSYGEIAPYAKGQPCELHNQTMTVTVLAEKD